MTRIVLCSRCGNNMFDRVYVQIQKIDLETFEYYICYNCLESFNAWFMSGVTVEEIRKG